MSIIIKGMEMPRSCNECPLNDMEYDVCVATPDRRSINIPRWEGMRLSHREKWCPLVEVPTPHGALIDRDKWADEMREKLLPELTKKYGEADALKGLHFSFLDCISNVDNADVIIAAE